MPKLYYTPTSCGAASFIAAHITGLKLETETIEFPDHATRKTQVRIFMQSTQKAMYLQLSWMKGQCLMKTLQH